MDHDDVLSFWFSEIDQSQWWIKDADFDRLVSRKFLHLHEQAVKCELFEWRRTAKGRLAEIIVLDQFSRNIFRNTPTSFSSDQLALVLAQEAINLCNDQQLNAVERSMMYMPYMHSESLKIHDVALGLFRENAIQSSLDFEIRHKRIIERFGRYPHRNMILNRISTKEEKAFLKMPGSGF